LKTGFFEMKTKLPSATTPFLKSTSGRLSIALAQAIFALVCLHLFPSFALLFLSAAFMILFLSFAFRRLQSISVSLAATLVSLSVVEAVAPLILTDNSMLTSVETNTGHQKGYFRKHDVIGSVAKEGVHTAAKRSISNNEIIYSVKYSIGNDGFRATPGINKEGASTEQETSRRINFFGCSWMFGEGLNDNETLPYFFLKSLNSASVKNFGFHGHGVNNALAIMQSNLDTSGSVNLLLTVPWHATRSACKDAWTNGFPRYVLDGEEVRKDGICGDVSALKLVITSLLSHSNIYRIIALRSSSAVDKDFELYLRLIDEMFKKSREKNQKFVVAFVRASKDYFSHSHYSNETIFSALSRSSDAIIDVTLAETAEEIDPSFFIHALDQHPSSKANVERAKLIFDLFKMKHLLP
jgi:hypothetical protein